jgi:hypothetical protein
MEEGLPLLPRLLGQMAGQPRPLPLPHLQQHASSLQPDSLHQSRLHAYQKKKFQQLRIRIKSKVFYDTENTIENNVEKIKTLERTIIDLKSTFCNSDNECRNVMLKLLMHMPHENSLNCSLM